VSIPDPFDVEPVHINITTASSVESLRALTQKAPSVEVVYSDTLRARISTLEALTDQLAEALRDAMENMDGWASYASDYFRTKHNLSGDLAEIASALDAYEADKEAHR
jgi:hypothetical protein